MLCTKNISLAEWSFPCTTRPSGKPKPKKHERADDVLTNQTRNPKSIKFRLSPTTLVMNADHSAKELPASRSILYVGATKYLTGTPISSAISRDWQKAGELASHFDNQGFDLDPEDSIRTIKELRAEIQGKAWDGILLGWCVRGHVEFTELYEQVMNVCVDETKSKEGVKLMFSTGPDNLFETVQRNFPE